MKVRKIMKRVDSIPFVGIFSKFLILLLFAFLNHYYMTGEERENHSIEKNENTNNFLWPSTVGGTIRTYCGDLVPDVLVTFHGKDSDSLPISGSMLSDATGSYQFSFNKAGVIFLNFSKSGYKFVLQNFKIEVFDHFSSNTLIDAWVSTPPTPIVNMGSVANGEILPDNSVNFRWSHSDPGVTKYMIEIGTTTDFSNLVLRDTGITVKNYSVSSGTLHYDSTYFWRVRGYSDCSAWFLNEGSTDWSTVWSFRTGVYKPVLLSPENTSTVSIRPTFTWTTVSGASQYEFEIHNTNLSFLFPVYSATVNKTTITMPFDLNNGSNYWWRVRAFNNAGSDGGFTDVFRLTTDAAIPVLKLPFNGDIGVIKNPVFEWFPSAGATSYTLQYSTDPSFAAFTEINTANTSEQVFGLEVLTTYYWRVKAVGPGGVTAWSSVWSFRTAAGKIAWAPNGLVFDPILPGGSQKKVITIYNQGLESLRISNISITGLNPDQFSFTSPAPLTIPAGGSIILDITFNPNSPGFKTADLLVDHNDASSPPPNWNPVVIPLSGDAVSSSSIINVPAVIDFGAIQYLSGMVERKFNITNSSTIPGDNLTVSSYYFETIDEKFGNTIPLPVIIEPGRSAEIIVRFNPLAIGSFTNRLHLINNSGNMPDAVIQLTASVFPTGLSVTPASIDFGTTSLQRQYVDSVIIIRNLSVFPVTINSKSMVEGAESFYFIRNEFPKILNPFPVGVDTIIIRFSPNDKGNKIGKLNILSTDPLASLLSVPLKGVGSDGPIINITPKPINFGDIGRGETKDTTITITNTGSLELKVSNNYLSGKDKELFSVSFDSAIFRILPGEEKRLKVHVKGDVPCGEKEALLIFVSNDINSSEYQIKLSANVKTGVISTVKVIDFDTLSMGYYADTIIVLRNEGNMDLSIMNLNIEGAHREDFSISPVQFPYILEPGKELIISIRFFPKSSGFRFSKIFILTGMNETESIILRGNCRTIYPQLAILDERLKLMDQKLDFGKVTIHYSKTKEFFIENVSRYNKIRIDSVYFEDVTNSPFTISQKEFPCYLPPGAYSCSEVKFSPLGTARSYSQNLYICYSDSTSAGNSVVVPLLVTGEVEFPGTYVDLPPVIYFGKVDNNKTATKNFNLKNLGSAVLRIDSITIIGESHSEFALFSPGLPKELRTDSSLKLSVVFSPKMIGHKEAYLNIFWNDVFNNGEILLLGESILSGEVTNVDVAKIPVKYSLSQNYPNPFNPSTMINYSVPENSHVSIIIFNSLGEEVAVIVNKYHMIGNYKAIWNPKNLASGLYFYKMRAGKFTEIKKMLYLR